MYRTTSVLALGLFLGLAPVQAQTQTDEATTAQQDQQQTTQQAEQDQQQQADADSTVDSMMVDTMIGSDVYSQDGEESIGTIDDVLISVDGEVEGIVVGVGGWLGVGERDVLMSFDQLSLEPQEDEFRLVTRMSREELETQPEFERVEMGERREQLTTRQQPPATQDTPTMQPGTTVETDTEQRETTATLQQDTAPQGETVAEIEATEDAELEQDTAQQDEPAQQGQTTEQETTEQGETVAEIETADEPSAQGTMQQDTTAQLQDDATGRIVFQDEDSILASTMLGASVRSQADEDMGEINDIMVSLEGTLEGYVIGVGGFLGIGQKDVILAPDRIEITREDDDDVRVTALETREGLESAPAFEGSASGQQGTMQQQSEPETQTQD